MKTNEKKLFASGVYIRQEQESDFNEISHIVDMDSKQWKSIEFNKSWVIEHIRSSPFYIPELAFIAHADDELAGYLMFSKLIIRENGIPHDSLLLGPLAIAPAFQKKGIARKMIEYGLQAAGEHGYATVFVCGHADFYQEMGFVPHVGIVGGNKDEAVLAYELVDGALSEISGQMEPFELLHDSLKEVSRNE
ncbi:GNAT family N-acetyltransferase [Paenibacillus pseudetheri]|uniref:N-acetyltransferase domain-containing protein n=1 Tax=Paenibacillus pseudetheri TaxID=2897682 RepID=A0ABN8FLT1_9BACL|nr:N-acetyltransferase [Paenibacillus pseudetheri]CAH1058971.1 hypothetical protein PAECIP111894_05157 [Paenibacillus pseudetheri]